MKKIDVVVFDLDSTLVTIEGLDWLAQQKGKGSEVSALTQLSMEGKIPVVEAFEKKIAMIAPSHKDFLTLGQKYCDCLVPGAAEVIEQLQKMGKEVWIVTGNFQPAAQIVAEKLGVEPGRIVSNTVEFDDTGQFKSFDSSQPLANNGGKKKVILEKIKRNLRVSHVGDAVTDLETKDVVDLFIGFGGVVKRAKVMEQAEVFIEEASLLPILDVLTHNEIAI